MKITMKDFQFKNWNTFKEIKINKMTSLYRLTYFKNLNQELQLKFHFVNLMKKEYLRIGKSLTISPMTVMI